MNKEQYQRAALRAIKAFTVDPVRVTSPLPPPISTEEFKTQIELRLRTASIPVVEGPQSTIQTNAAVLNPVYTINTVRIPTVAGQMTICGVSFRLEVYDLVTIHRTKWITRRSTYGLGFLRCCEMRLVIDVMQEMVKSAMDTLINDYLAAQCDEAIQLENDDEGPPLNRP